MNKNVEKLKNIVEAIWSGDVKTKWEPPEGLFTKSADEIAKVLKAQSDDLETAMGRLNFYINRSGKNLSDEDKARLEKAKELLHKSYEK